MRKPPRDPKRQNVAERGNRSQAGTPASVERESPHAPDVSPKNKKKLAAEWSFGPPMAEELKPKKIKAKGKKFTWQVSQSKAACELDLIPEVGYICPSCKIFVKFHVKQKARLACMQSTAVVSPRKALLF